MGRFAAIILSLSLTLLFSACGTSPAQRFCVDATGCDPGQRCENSICVAPETDTTADTEEDGGDDTVEDTSDTKPDTLPDTLDTDADVEDTAPDTAVPSCDPPEIGLFPNNFSNVLVDRLELLSGEGFAAIARGRDGLPSRLIEPSVWLLDGPSPMAFDAAIQNPLGFNPERGEWRLVLDWATSESCRGRSEPLTIVVSPPRVPPTIRVTLRWSPEPAGTTTDFDLHMTRVIGGSATWSDANDCYYRNTAPDWGAAGAANNPLFSGDDRGTPGVEVITLIEAADPDYLVGINLYRDIGAPGAEATVIIETPSLAYTNSRTLSGTGEVWYPVAIRRYAPDTYQLVELNTTSAGFTGITLP